MISFLNVVEYSSTRESLFRRCVYQSDVMRIVRKNWFKEKKDRWIHWNKISKTQNYPKLLSKILTKIRRTLLLHKKFLTDSVPPTRTKGEHLMKALRANKLNQ